ncbi:MAG: hypothetical protein U0559_17745 [Anaerolineae bacterium]
MRVLSKAAKFLFVTYFLITMGSVLAGYLFMTPLQVTRLIDVLSPRIIIGGGAGVLMGLFQGRQWGRMVQMHADDDLYGVGLAQKLEYRKHVLIALGLIGGSFVFNLLMSPSIQVAYARTAALVWTLGILIVTFFGAVLLALRSVAR